MEHDQEKALSEEKILQKRREAARERLRAAEQRRLELAASEQRLSQVEAEERAADDEAAIADAEQEHGIKRIGVVRTDFGCVIVKRPNPVIYKRFRDRGEHNTEALEKLVRSCLVYPSASRFDKVLEEVPAALDRAATSIIELAGFRAKEVSGK
jgi:hypothetical protein